ncbi:hypothetical protein T492DRAFT_522819 [Pavlovales sp. CCMP2436]|nr:hypothetical protein T492DRAFT_522819 [Pavlovales sp. CCMP2436]
MIQRLIAETVSRQKDEEANRFMRHEIKNGLLAVVGCFAGLHELHAQGVKEGHVVSGDFSSAFDTSISELNGMLQRTLDTVLAQAMAREVVHGTYAPRPEPTNLRELLGHGDGLPVKLFTIVCEPLSFPLLDIDPRLVSLFHFLHHDYILLLHYDFILLLHYDCLIG